MLAKQRKKHAETEVNLPVTRITFKINHLQEFSHTDFNPRFFMLPEQKMLEKYSKI